MKVRRHHSISPPRYMVVICAVGAVVLLVGAGYVYYLQSRPLVLSRSQLAEASFTVYTPVQPPEEYRLKEEATRLDASMLSYTFSHATAGRDITVTVQPLPRGFDMKQMAEGGSLNGNAISSGTLYNLSAGDSTRYLLDTGGSLVFLTSPQKIDTETVTSLAESLKKRN